MARVAEKLNLVGLTWNELEQTISHYKHPNLLPTLWSFLYNKGGTDFNEMHFIPKTLRRELHSSFFVDYGHVIAAHTSRDGSRKWLMKFEENSKSAVESVYMPQHPRGGSICVSSQIGCSLSCAFCHTGTMRLTRNLTAAEIVRQVMHARAAVGDIPSEPNTQRQISNIVFMGQGEPLLNYRNVKAAIEVISDHKGISIGKRHITVSTSGIAPAILKLGRDLDVNLAISLHAVTNELRDVLVPINKTYPIETVLESCREYARTNSHRIMFEYVMLEGVNDSLAEANELSRLISDLPCLVNLIPFNPWPGSQFKCSSETAIRAFQKKLNENNVAVFVRTTRGEDIMAACGQLHSHKNNPQFAQMQ